MPNPMYPSKPAQGGLPTAADYKREKGKKKKKKKGKKFNDFKKDAMMGLHRSMYPKGSMKADPPV